MCLCKTKMPKGAIFYHVVSADALLNAIKETKANISLEYDTEDSYKLPVNRECLLEALQNAIVDDEKNIDWNNCLYLALEENVSRGYVESESFLLTLQTKCCFDYICYSNEVFKRPNRTDGDKKTIKKMQRSVCEMISANQDDLKKGFVNVLNEHNCPFMNFLNQDNDRELLFPKNSILTHLDLVKLDYIEYDWENYEPKKTYNVKFNE